MSSSSSPALFRAAAWIGAVAGVLFLGRGLYQLLSMGDVIVPYWLAGALFVALAVYARRRARA